MVKLYDISSYLDLSKQYNFGDFCTWKGKILLNSDGWFEGIINYQDDTIDNIVKSDLFIYGIYIPNKIIRIVEAIPYNKRSILKNIAIGTYYCNEFSYVGKNSIGSDTTQVNYGVAKIDVREVLDMSEFKNLNIIYRNIEEEKEKLCYKLTSVRSTIPFKKLYTSLFNNRHNQVNLLLQLVDAKKKKSSLVKSPKPVRSNPGRKIV